MSGSRPKSDRNWSEIDDLRKWQYVSQLKQAIPHHYLPRNWFQVIAVYAIVNFLNHSSQKINNSLRTTNWLHDIWHGFQFPCCSICPVLWPRLASNFHQHNDVAERKFGCFGWKVTLCNFWDYYTKYYTLNKNPSKSVIYIGFWGAWLSVNP